MHHVFGGALRRLGRRGVLIATGCLIGVAVAAGVALGTVPDGNGIVHLCYQVDQQGQIANGDLRVIDPDATKKNDQACTTKETALEINQNGTPGPVGPAGPTGPQGPRRRREPPGPAPRATGAARRAGARAGVTGPIGATGAGTTPALAGGATGATGPQGTGGSPGATGGTGPATRHTGATGARPRTGQPRRGATGAHGPPGQTGSTGPHGPSCAVSVGTRRIQTRLHHVARVPVAGADGECDLRSGCARERQITIGSTIAAGACGLRLWICYQPSGGTLTTPHPIDWVDAQVVQNLLITYPITDTITGLGTGSYTVGLCGSRTPASQITGTWGLVVHDGPGDRGSIDPLVNDVSRGERAKARSPRAV